MAEWPDGNRAALSLSFDNLGEAAEVNLGAAALPDGASGDHFTVTEVLPALLAALATRRLEATFFVEGVNADAYPAALAEIRDGGHEVGFHAWCHEDWAGLSAEEQAENLERGLAAFDRLGLETSGMRPPGGLLGRGGLDPLREAGLRYCSPAGAGAGAEEGIALLPFQWQHVDATCVLPPLAPVRERIAGTPDPLDPDTFAGHLEAEIDRLADEGGYMAIVLHLSMIEHWLGTDRLARLLERVEREARGEDVWVATCAEVAEHVLANPDRFEAGNELDSASWASGG